jgi:hypothetical protein
MPHGFTSTRHTSKSLKSFGSMKAAGANVKGSNLNAKGDMSPRGKRGGGAKMSTRKTKTY